MVIFKLGTDQSVIDASSSLEGNHLFTLSNPLTCKLIAISKTAGYTGLSTSNPSFIVSYDDPFKTLKN